LGLPWRDTPRVAPWPIKWLLIINILVTIAIGLVPITAACAVLSQRKEWQASPAAPSLAWLVLYYDE
jgi:hypothetical protein